MEHLPRVQENQNPSLIPSPNTHGTTSRSTSSSNSNSNSNSNGLHSSPPPQPPSTPRPITRSEPNHPCPTTFVQADTSSFKQVVQMLTGSSLTAKVAAAAAAKTDPPRNPIPPIKSGLRKERASRLYERRNSLKSFKISPLVPGVLHGSGFSSRRPSTPEILSPSLLDFPSLVLSPVTPLAPDPFNRFPNNTTPANVDVEAEDKAIATKGFYLHPSPSNTPRDSEPRLLPLFPVTSPRVSGSS